VGKEWTDLARVWEMGDGARYSAAWEATSSATPVSCVEVVATVSLDMRHQFLEHLGVFSGADYVSSSATRVEHANVFRGHRSS